MISDYKDDISWMIDMGTIWDDIADYIDMLQSRELIDTSETEMLQTWARDLFDKVVANK